MFNNYSERLEKQNIQNFKDRAKWLAEFTSKNIEAYHKNKKSNKNEVATVYKSSALFSVRKLLDICLFLSEKDYFSDEEVDNFNSLIDFIDASIGFDSFNDEQMMNNIKNLADLIILPVVSAVEEEKPVYIWQPTLTFEQPTAKERKSNVKIKSNVVAETEIEIPVANEKEVEKEVEKKVEEVIKKAKSTTKSIKAEKQIEIPVAVAPSEAIKQTTVQPQETIKTSTSINTQQETTVKKETKAYKRIEMDDLGEEEMPKFETMPTYAEFMGNRPQATGRAAYLNNKFAEQDKLKGESIQIPPPANFRKN